MLLSDREFSIQLKARRIYSSIIEPMTIDEIMRKTRMGRDAVTRHIWELCESELVRVIRRKPYVFERTK